MSEQAPIHYDGRWWYRTRLRYGCTACIRCSHPIPAGPALLPFKGLRGNRDRMCVTCEEKIRHEHQAPQAAPGGDGTPAGG